MTAIRARLAPIPIAPREMSIAAAVWSSGVQINCRSKVLVSFSPLMPNFRPGPTTTAMVRKKVLSWNTKAIECKQTIKTNKINVFDMATPNQIHEWLGVPTLKKISSDLAG